jgi:hypothetical protein
MIALIIFWVALCFVAAAIANKKGRSGIGFFILALFLSPLIGVIGALIAKPNIPVVEQRQIYSGEGKKCPHCAEIIKREAKVCRYCGKDLPPPTAEAELEERFEVWWRNLIVGPLKPAQRAEYRKVFDELVSRGEL